MVMKICIRGLTNPFSCEGCAEVETVEMWEKQPGHRDWVAQAAEAPVHP